LNISRFEQIIKELSIKYTIQDIDVITLLVKSAEDIFKVPIQVINKENKIFLIKVSNNKKINLTNNTLKKLSNVFEDKLKTTNKTIQITRAKKILKSKVVVLFEIVKKLDNCFICSFNGLIAILPFSNIAKVDLENFILGSKHYAVIHSYSYLKQQIILNCKHHLVEIKKVQSILLNTKITKVNRYYRQRVKIYANNIPPKVVINNLKMIYPKERIIFLKDKNAK